MDRTAWITRWMALAAGAALLMGCSKPDLTVSDGEGGKATVSQDGAKMTFEDKEGKTTTVETGKDGGTVKVQSKDGDSSYESGANVTEADLGLPFYPGSVEKPNGSVKAETPDGKSVASIRTTSDQPGKVIEFYKAKLKEATTQSTSAEGTDHSMLFGKTDTGAEVVITAVRPKDKPETDVSVSVSTKKEK